MDPDEEIEMSDGNKYTRREILVTAGAMTAGTALSVDAATESGGEQAIGAGTGAAQLSDNYRVTLHSGPSNIAPQSPQPGDRWDQTDTGKRLVYDGENWNLLPLSTGQLHSSSTLTKQLNSTVYYASEHASIQDAMDALGSRPGTVEVDDPGDGTGYTEDGIAVPDNTKVVISADVTRPNGSDKNVFESQGIAKANNQDGRVAENIHFVDGGGSIDVNRNNDSRGFGTLQNGIIIQGQYCSVGDVTVIDAEWHAVGFYGGGAGNVIHSPTAINARGSAFFCHFNESNQNRVEHVTMHSPTSIGCDAASIYISGANVDVRGGEIQGSGGGVGVYVYDGDQGIGCEDVTLGEALTVRDTTTHGIRITEQNGGQMDNISVRSTVINAGSDGVLVDGAVNSPEISATVKNATTRGIRCETNVISPQLDGYFVEESGGVGVYCLPDNSIIRGTVKNGSDIAHQVGGSNCVIDIRAFDDQGTKTQTDGLYFNAGTDYNQVSGNIRGNINSGIGGTVGANTNSSALIT